MLKKGLCFMLAIIISFGALCFCVSADTNLYGDLDGNGKINASDALVILKSAVHKLTLPKYLEKYADVNGDTDINASDALLVLRKAVGKIEQFPAEINTPEMANEQLKKWLFEYGTVNGSYMECVYEVDNNEYSVFYDANYDNITVQWSYVDGDYFFYGSIFLDSYYFGISFTDFSTDELVCKATGYLDARNFTHNYPIEYSYSGDDSLEYLFRETTRTTLCDLLDFFSWFLETNDLGLTLADFGFVSL